MKTNFFGKIVVAASGLFLLATAHAAAPFYSPGGVAIKGYDPVAYFSDSKPVPGSDAYVTEWKGVKWKFASQEHLDKFKAEPEKYAPQYGGYCAFGTSQGHLAPTSPAAWTISDGKLYLNYNEQVQKKWSKDVAGYNKLADEQFDTLLKGPTE
ncbi:MAG: YHS domain-containing protein [Nevskia sp.]|jgi:YHS domain-containing protein|nr:YHS domain-containing protein [Nevskia sp.]MCK9383810.1 YHS domain-containing protein [Nevskia sp.]